MSAKGQALLLKLFVELPPKLFLFLGYRPPLESVDLAENLSPAFHLLGRGGFHHSSPQIIDPGGSMSGHTGFPSLAYRVASKDTMADASARGVSLPGFPV